MLKKLWCRIFGHKEYTMVSPSFMETRAVWNKNCPRCGVKLREWN